MRFVLKMSTVRINLIFFKFSDLSKKNNAPVLPETTVTKNTTVKSSSASQPREPRKSKVNTEKPANNPSADEAEYDDYEVYHNLGNKTKRAKRKPKPYVVGDTRYEKFNIKTGFKSVFDRETGKGKVKAEKKLEAAVITAATPEAVAALQALLNKKVIETSLWTIEAGLYIHYCLYQLLASGNEEAINNEFNQDLQPNDKYFLKYFMSLCAKRAPKCDPPTATYAAIKNIPGHNRQYVGNIINHAATIFKSNFKNNVVIHTKTHVRRFLQHMYPGKKNKVNIKRTIDHLFNDETLSPDKSMKKTVERVLQRSRFHAIDDTWYNIVPALWRLQRFNEANDLPNFTIIPQYGHGRKAIRIDTLTLYGLLNSLLKRGQKLKHNLNEPINAWCPYFNYLKFETGQRKFDFSITTDGTAFVSLQFARPKKPVKTPAEWKTLKDKNLERIRTKYANDEYKIIAGVDEGLKLMVAAHAQCRNENGIPVQKLTKYKCKSFQYDSGQLYFKQKSRPIIQDTLDAVEIDRAVFPLQTPNYNDDFGYQLTVDLRDEALIERRRLNREKYKNYLLEREAAGTLTQHQKRTLHRQQQFLKVDYRHRMELSKKSWNFHDYVRFEMKHLATVQGVLVNPTLAHHKFKRSIFITKTAVNIATQLAETGEIIPNQRVKYRHSDKVARKSRQFREERKGKFEYARKTSLIFLGNFKLEANSPMKGHPRSAHGQFLRELKRRCDVITINEHNTTKSCAFCRKHLEVAKPPERFSQCRCIDDKRKVFFPCLTLTFLQIFLNPLSFFHYTIQVWNRDINAAMNMRILGELHLQSLPRPKPFTIGFKLIKQSAPLRRNIPATFKRDPDVYSNCSSEEE